MDTNPNTEEPTIVVKSKFVDLIFSKLKEQSFLVLLFCVAVFYFYMEVKELKTDFRQCIESRLETSERKEAKLVEVVINNTNALERFIREEQYRRARED